ncbi:PREDICTED: putative FBD-associated F-box protein At5g53635 isoform X1 [Camelina sativa]|uniref:FBD-associated F-box protein At5g53635 isoform X1 n=1 Tax=Camelina sativa TaxID=90675 RepID=A0ABM0Y6N0_CAMSA|nr:PREDICTED: putative FBD-associated F-box protein At5g53635 isoform X1 [Camelina sativa]
MVGRRKSKQARFKGSNRSRRLKEEDRISQLPDPLICHILSHLPTKEAVSTSVLSTRWKTLWLWVPSLELNSRKLPDLSAFSCYGNRFFDSSRVSHINELKLIIADIRFINGDDYDSSCFTSWIDAAIKRKVQHLYVRFPLNSCLDVMPLSVCNSESSVSLKLHLVALPNGDFVSLPCLKTLHLNTVCYPDETTFERLVSSCPVLEELEVKGSVSCKAKVFRVLSKSLKRVVISLRFSLFHLGSEVEVDTPRLRFLRIDENLSERFVITDMDSNVKLDLRLRSGMVFDKAYLSKKKRLRNFLPQISKVRDMFIHLDTFKLLYEYSKLESLPQFGCMSRLQVALYYNHSKWLPTFLESFPNLKFLILVCYDDDSEETCSEEMNHFSFSHVPQCLLSSLESVDFKVPIRGLGVQMELVRYFLKNSAVLKKLTLPLPYDAIQIQDDFVKKLLKIKRRSTECEVVFL